MLNLAANLTYMWAELPLLDRFDAAAEAGFAAVEVQQPYDVPVPEMRAALARNDLRMLLLNAPGPNYTGGARGFAAVPGGEARFDYDMKRAVRYAQALGAHMIHVMSGVAGGSEAHRTFVENLRRAAGTLPEGMVLNVEPLNTGDNPGYFMSSYDLAREVLAEVDAPNVQLQFDSYHAQLMTGDAVACLRECLPLVGHVQLGDAPGRTAPGIGDVDFPALFRVLEEAGYPGWVAAEYNAEDRTEKTLGWMP